MRKKRTQIQNIKQENEEKEEEEERRREGKKRKRGRKGEVLLFERISLQKRRKRLMLANVVTIWEVGTKFLLDQACTNYLQICPVLTGGKKGLVIFKYEILGIMVNSSREELDIDYLKGLQITQIRKVHEYFSREIVMTY